MVESQPPRGMNNGTFCTRLSVVYHATNSLFIIVCMVLIMSDGNKLPNSGIPIFSFHDCSVFASHYLLLFRPFPCARLSNLPFDATLEDILILFQGLVVIDVVLIGQGEAFVIFANPMDYQMALQR